MLPVIALVGRPNVGKSTLFNCLTRSRDALVADYPGLTRDRQYGLGKIGPLPYLVIDTGGLADDVDTLSEQIAEQALAAVAEADAVLLLVDGRAGLTSADETIAQQLRRQHKPLYLAINKSEHLDPELAASEFHSLGLGHPYTVSATHKQGVEALLEAVLAALPTRAPKPTQSLTDGALKLAVVGRPNVGKSTLINRLLGEQRVLATDLPGTTRDSIFVPFSKDKHHYILIDTAGVRRRGRVHNTIEKFSVIKTLQAIEQSHVTLLLLDARQGISEQDASLLGYVLERGRALVIAVNKWDRLEPNVRRKVRADLDRKLAFVNFARMHFISALHGTGIIDILDSVNEAYSAATRELSTPELTRMLEAALKRHQPPLVHGHSIKLRYAHQGGRNPPVIVIHGSRTDHIPEAYRRYLMNIYRERLSLHGTPVRIEFKSGENPYQPSSQRRRSSQVKSKKR